MKANSLPWDEDFPGYRDIVTQGLLVERHSDVLRWMRGAVQECLPHDILLVGWGNFPEGAIQHDIVSELPGARSYAAGTDCLPFLLGKFHDSWVAAGRVPCRLDFRAFDYLLGSVSLPGSFADALHSMRSVLIHGVSDERSRQDCLYVLLSAHEDASESAASALRILLPHIDGALRQVAHLPQQHKAAPPPAPKSPSEDVCGLSERETQIMAWVAMGKTNSEIGSILNISAFTVKNHMQRIFQKLNVFNRAQAVSKVTRVALDG